jgi:hypothetical protein
LITIGEVARAFGKLPSEVADHASTFDLMVYDVLMAWDKYKEDKQNGKLNPESLDEAELMKLLKRARE